MNKLHSGARWLFRLRALTTGVIFIFVSLFFIFNNSSRSLGWVFLVLGLIYIFVVEIYTQMSYNRWFYEFGKGGLKLERGIIWKKYSNVPYERIQNVDIHRGIIARMFGFSSVNIQTAGYSGGYGHYRRGGLGSFAYGEGYIPAVSVEDAEKIRESVMKKISGKGI